MKYEIDEDLAVDILSHLLDYEWSYSRRAHGCSCGCCEESACPQCLRSLKEQHKDDCTLIKDINALRDIIY